MAFNDIQEEREEFTSQVSKETIIKELKMCKDFYINNQGSCNWGTCSACGVIPMLIKLHEGRLIENPTELINEKKRIFDSMEEDWNV